MNTNIIELTEKQSNAFEAMKTGKNVFLTGPGGSGKSFLLKHVIFRFFNNEISYFPSSIDGLICFNTS